MGYLEALNVAICGVLAGFTIYLIARAFQDRRSQSYEAAGIRLPPRKWCLVAAVLVVIALIDIPIYRAVDNWRLQRAIPQLDPNKLSIVIPEFAGSGGAEAARTVKGILESALGPGVQILTVPPLPAEKRYGLAEEETNKLHKESLFCAARYQGDVVVWGTSLSSGLVSVSYTAKGGACSLPSPCGVVPGRSPTAYKLADSADPSSPMSRALSRSVVSSLRLAVDMNDDLAKPNACLSDLKTARTLAAKGDALLAGNPVGLDDDHREVAVSLTALFHAQIFKQTKDLKQLNTAIKLLEQEISRQPKSSVRLLPFLAQLLGDKIPFVDAEELSSIITRLDDLATTVGSRNALSMRELAAAATETSHFNFGTKGALPDARQRYLSLLKMYPEDGDKKLHLNIRLFGLGADELERAPGPENYKRAAIYRTQAYRAINSRSEAQLARIWIGDRCTLARADLTLEQFRKDPLENARTINRVYSLLPANEIDWQNRECTDALRRFGQHYSQLYELAASSGMKPSLKMLLTRREIEQEIFDKDKTQSKSSNRAWLAIAMAKLALASGNEADRKDAVAWLGAAIRDGRAERDAGKVKLLQDELASLTNGR